MRPHEGPRERISLGALIVLTDELTSTPAPRREARLVRLPAPSSAGVWGRMSVLERGLAADRDDPSYDYAAN